MTDYRRLRMHAGLADLQAWTRFELVGPQACDALDAVVGCNVRELFEGRAANTLIPSSSGGIDAIVWVIALENGYRVVAEPGTGKPSAASSHRVPPAAMRHSGTFATRRSRSP